MPRAAPDHRRDTDRLTRTARSIDFARSTPAGASHAGTRGLVETSAATGVSSTKALGIVSQQAIIKTGGKQYRVAPGSVLRVEKLAGEPSSTISFDEVLLVGSGDDVKIGTPVVSGAKVSAEIVAHGRGPKLVVYKFRRRKQYRRKNGHRQAYTEIKVTEISA